KYSRLAPTLDSVPTSCGAHHGVELGLQLAHVGRAHAGDLAVPKLPRPDGGAADRLTMAASRHMADHDHEARNEPEVVRVQLEVLPRAGDVGEVLAQAGMAEVGLLAPQQAPGALEMELAAGRQVAQDAVDVALPKRRVYRP